MFNNIQYDEKNDVLSFKSDKFGDCDIGSCGAVSLEHYVFDLSIKEMKEIIKLYENRKNSNDDK
jgi:hypothetical protein